MKNNPTNPNRTNNSSSSNSFNSFNSFKEVVMKNTNTMKNQIETAKELDLADAINKKISKMSAEEIEQRVSAIMANKAKRLEYQKTRNQREDVKMARKAYQAKRAMLNKAIIAAFIDSSK